MGLRFRQSFTLFPGVRLNVGKRGISTSFGVPGATLNLSRRGIRGTVGLPGTGLSYSAMLSERPAAPCPQELVWQPPATPQADPTTGPRAQPQPYTRSQGMQEIASSAVERLTTPGLSDLRAMVTDAARQRQEISSDLIEAKSEHSARRDELAKKSNSLFRFLFKKRIAILEPLVPELLEEIDRLSAWLEATHIDIEFDADDAAQRGYASLIRAYEALCTSVAAWDVTGDRGTNRIAERTAAARVVDRRPIRPHYSESPLVRFGGKAMRFPNANGEDILLYPGLILMQRGDGQFALLDVRDVQVTSEPVTFIEDEAVPADAVVVGQTWAKVNKDGSPDRRFKDNYSIPLCSYGRLSFGSKTGLREEYQFSNADAALAFGTAFDDYQAALRDLGETGGASARTSEIANS